IENGAVHEYDEEGNLVSIIGRQADGTHVFNPVVGPTPPAPATFSVSGGAGVYRVTWDGSFVNGAVAPLDFARVEVHMSTTSGFTPDPLPNSSTRVASIEVAGGGEAAVIRVSGTYYVRLVTRST